MIKRILAAMLALFFAAAFAAVDVNKATQTELEAVKGIGPAISGKILDERKKGSFKDWQDLVDRVKGIGEGNAAKFSAEGLTVNGAAFSGAPAKAVPAAKKEDKPAVKAEANKSAASAGAAAAVQADAKPAAVSADDKKAAARKAAEDKKAAKAAAAEEAKKAKAEKAAAKKAAKEGSPVAATASSPASAAAKK